MKLTKIILLIALLTFFGASLSFSQDAKPEDTKAADDTINSEPADIKAATQPQQRNRFRILRTADSSTTRQ
jgi:hypothetical protein